MGAHTVMCVVAQSCPTLCNPMDCSLPGSFAHGDSPDKNTAVGCHALLQEIFPIQGSNPGLTHCRQVLLPSEPPGKSMYSDMGVQNLTAKDLQTKGKTEQKYLSDFLKSSDTQFNFINSVLICERTKFYSLRNG